MQNYSAYRSAVGITPRDMINSLKRFFPNFNKQICSYTEYPSKYGISLCREAETVLVKSFGEGPGLSTYHFAPTDLPKKKEKPYRKKDQRITVWMTNDMYFRLLSLKTKGIYPTFQSLAEAALTEFIERNTMGASQ